MIPGYFNQITGPNMEQPNMVIHHLLIILISLLHTISIVVSLLFFTVAEMPSKAMYSMLNVLPPFPGPRT